MALGIGTAILGSSFLGAAASLFGGRSESRAARRSAALQAQAAAQGREDLLPFTEAGVGSLNELQILLGLSGTPEEQQAAQDALSETPGFQFEREEGVKALDISAASRGGLLSGNQLKGVTEFGQGLAQRAFGSRVNQLFSLAGLGQASAAGQANIGQTGALNQGNALIASGQARAAGFAGVANAANAGIGNFLFNNFLTQQATSRQQSRSLVGNPGFMIQ